MTNNAEPNPDILFEPIGQSAEQDCACGDEFVLPATLPAAGEPWQETDCACPDARRLGAPTAPLHRNATLMRRAPQLERAPLSGEYQTVFNPANPVHIAVLNRPGRSLLDSFARPSTVDQVARRLPDIDSSRLASGVQALTALNLLEPAAEVQRQSGGMPGPRPATLNVWLHVTNACNLNCAYCYLPKNREMMDPATGQAALATVFRTAVRHGFAAVKVKYAGGEPTMNFGLVRVLHERARGLATRTGLALSEVLLTNGVALAPAMLDFCRSAGMRLAISLDGSGPAHDAQRCFGDGRGSFDLVWRGLERAMEHGLRPHLSITITKRNVHSVVQVVNMALEHELLFNLNFYRPCAAHEQDDLRVDEAELIVSLRQVLGAIEARLPRYAIVGGLLDRANLAQPHTHACGAGRSYLVVDTRGRIARCQMEIEKPVATVDSEDPLARLGENNASQPGSVDDRETCQDCTWRYWCAGGCPLLAQGTSALQHAPSLYCNVYRALYPRLVRLEGLRLLRAH